MPKKSIAKKNKKNPKWGSEIKVIGLVVGAFIIGVVAIHPSLYSLWKQQTMFPVGNSSIPDSKVRTISYKPALLGGEIPSTWSSAYLGDVGPMPIPKDPWLDPRYIVHSFSPRGVAMGDMNWEQIDVYQIENKDLIALVDTWKTDDEFNQYVAAWTKETIDGRLIDVVIFPTEPDGTISKGGTGGKIYFIPTNPENNNGYPFALIIAKQAKGEQEFEDGFEHFIQGLDLDQLENITFTP